MRPTSFMENRRMDVEIDDAVFGNRPCREHPESTIPAPRYSTEIEPAARIIERLRKAGLDVVIGCYQEAFAVEIQKLVDRYGNYARHRLVFVNGAISIPSALAQAALQPDTLAALAESDGKPQTQA